MFRFRAPPLPRNAVKARDKRLLRACSGDKEQAARVKRMIRRPR